MCGRRQKDGMTIIPSSMLQQTLPPKVGVEETKAGHSGRQMGRSILYGGRGDRWTKKHDQGDRMEGQTNGMMDRWDISWGK